MIRPFSLLQSLLAHHLLALALPVLCLQQHKSCTRSLVRLDLQAQLALPEQMVQQDRPDQQAQREPLALTAPLDLRGRLARKEQRVLLARQVQPDRQDLPDRRVPQVQQAPLGQQVLQDRQARLVQADQRGQQGLPDQRVQRERLAQQVRLDQQGLRVRQAPLDRPDLLDPLDQQAQLVQHQL